MTKLDLNVKGMSCQHCVQSIEGALNKIGVQTVKVNLKDDKVYVEFDETKISDNDITEAIEDQGYDVV
ncbi:copper chaperone CopZ [Ammoniphilus sp. YIM 78166]|uniref:copper chaperone CopZ n=1 Tax=Ammoniphilus sp. YIM 78166 TaxID=1644106 RepID=UPI00106FB6CD|nr:copper chaperone CopZ [Ammoniphilus sp. YIM 78166]